MKATSTSAEIRSERFSNGLEITASHVRLGDQTWAVGQIKQVGIGPAATGTGMIFCGLLVLLFVPAFFGTLDNGEVGAAIMSLLLAILCGYGVRSSWVGVNSTQVWLKTGLLVAVVFKSRDTDEAQRVKALLERAIAQHTPA